MLTLSLNIFPVISKLIINNYNKILLLKIDCPAYQLESTKMEAQSLFPNIVILVINKIFD
jgi:hypothetical protein